ncbi:Glycerol kinase, partial [hydrothermal vent metagenome]
DILNTVIERPLLIETTAFGAAGISGIASGFWSREKFFNARKVDRMFTPGMDKDTGDTYYSKWKEAVKRAMNWVEG